MRIVEQAFIATERLTSVKAEYPARAIFQVFVKGKLQYGPSYRIEDDTVVLTCLLEDFGSVQKKLDEMHIEIEKAELQRIPKDYKKLELQEALKVMKFVDALEDDDDVSSVFHNLEMTEELENEL